MTDSPWYITRSQSRALCILTASWQVLDLPYGDVVLPSLARRRLVERKRYGGQSRWRLTKFGVSFARRFGRVAAVNRRTA